MNVVSKEETVAAAKRVLRCVLRCVMWRVMWRVMRCVMRCVIDKQLIIKQYRTYL